MPKILKTNKYPVTHWMLFPNKNYYCNDCFYISIIIYESDTNYKSSLKRFKQSYVKTIKDRSKKKYYLTYQLVQKILKYGIK